MPIGFIYFLLIVIWFLFGGFIVYTPEPNRTRYSFGGNLLLFISLLIVGFSLYGSPITGH